MVMQTKTGNRGTRAKATIDKGLAEPSDLLSQVGKKLRGRLDARDEQVITGSGAGDVEEMPFRVIDLLQVGVVADRLDALHFVVTGHHRDGPELQALGHVHRAYGNKPFFSVADVIEHLVRLSRLLDCGLSSALSSALTWRIVFPSGDSS